MYTPYLERTVSLGAQQRLFKFENSYGASVVRGPYTYGGDQGLFELAVMEFDGDESSICYSTPITNDVLGYLTEDEVQSYLAQIEQLPPKAREE